MNQFDQLLSSEVCTTMEGYKNHTAMIEDVKREN